MFSILLKNNSSKTGLIIYVLALSIIMPLPSILNPQLLGEDEALTFLASSNILNHISNFNFVGFVSEIVKDWHPPGRNLFPLWSMKIFGSSMTSIRFPYYLIWIMTCILGVLITKKFSNDLCAYICATLLAGSGLFHLQTMALSHGIVSFVGMLIIYLITKNKILLSESFSIKRFLLLSSIIFIGFLFFNTLILLAAMLHVIQFFLIFKSKNIKYSLIKFIITSIFIFIFYLIYYFIFIGVPMLMVNSNDFLIFLKTYWGISDFGNWDGKKFGQYHQYNVRSGSSKFNISSLIANIRYLNWHFFPILSLFIVPCSIFILYISFRKVFFLILPYLIVTNFVMSGNTGQHFASAFIWLIPFFCIYLSILMRSSNVKKVSITLFLTLILPFTLWAHILPYNEINYPYNIVNNLYGSKKWPPNLNRSLKLISNTVKKHILIKDKIAYDTDGSIILHYLNDFQSSKIKRSDFTLIKADKCLTFSNTFKVLITNNTYQPCLQYTKKRYTFNGSKINVYIFKDVL